MNILKNVYLSLIFCLCIPVAPACAWRGNGWNTGATHLNYKGAQLFYNPQSDAWVSSKPVIFVDPTVMKNIILPVGANITPVSAGDGQACFVIPAELAGMRLLSVGAHVYTASSGGTPGFQIRKKRIADDTDVDMLSTLLTIDATERDSVTASTASVIDSTNSAVATGDEIYLDVDSAGTGTAGAEIRLGFGL